MSLRALVQTVVGVLLFNQVPARLLGIPTAPFETQSGGAFSLANVRSILVDPRYENAVDERGQTLIPPTLRAFATTFASDLGGFVAHNITVESSSHPRNNTIFLTVGNPNAYLDAAGHPTSEGYTLNVTSFGVVITGASPLGSWWGTRTILQQAILNNGTVPVGSGTDAPGWGVRGEMLDCGRHFYPKEFLIDMCAYMSFFKQNTFHLHVSDNLYNNPNYTREQSTNLYARFRLWSEDPAVAGLATHFNESYTRADFDEIQSSCAARGVTIFPEIEAPGHALVITQWRPEIAYDTDMSLLNISHPNTIPTMHTIWDTFLPWFHTKTVSIGADEYTGPASEYNSFVNAMDEYIGTVSGKSMRIWGTFPPNHTAGYNNIYQNVSVQHWEFSDDNPYYDYILNNYSVLNSDDAFYIVNKWSGSYPQQINLTRTFEGNPNGSYWYPYIFDMSNSTNNPPRNNPLVLGEIAAHWNDYGANASVFSEAYYNLRSGIPALADKQWGGDLSASEFSSIFETLHAGIPAQNLDRAVPSISSSIFSYRMANSTNSGLVHDTSGNGYDAHTTCAMSNSSLLISSNCTLTTPLGSKGRDYTLSLSLKVDTLSLPTNATLIAGPDSTLMLTPNVTFYASGNYFRLNNTLPLGTSTDLSIIARGNHTYATIGNSSIEHEFLTQMGINGDYFVWAPMAFEAPLSQIGGAGSGWTGELSSFSLTSVA